MGTIPRLPETSYGWSKYYSLMYVYFILVLIHSINPHKGVVMKLCQFFKGNNRLTFVNLGGIEEGMEAFQCPDPSIVRHFLMLLLPSYSTLKKNVTALV